MRSDCLLIKKSFQFKQSSKLWCISWIGCCYWCCNSSWCCN